MSWRWSSGEVAEKPSADLVDAINAWLKRIDEKDNVRKSLRPDSRTPAFSGKTQ